MPLLIGTEIDVANFKNDGFNLNSQAFIYPQNINIKGKLLVKSPRYDNMKIGMQYRTSAYLGSWYTDEAFEVYLMQGASSTALTSQSLFLGQGKNEALALKTATAQIPANTYFAFRVIHIFRHTHVWCEKKSWGRRKWHNDRSDTYELINKALDFDILNFELY